MLLVMMQCSAELYTVSTVSGVDVVAEVSSCQENRHSAGDCGNPVIWPLVVIQWYSGHITGLPQ